MTGFIRRVFGSASPPSGARGASARAQDTIDDALFEEFCRTFCYRPGVNFMDFLKAEGVTRMIEWLRPATTCALTKAFIRLAVDATRKGQNIWEMPGLSMLYEGYWDPESLPGRDSLDAMSVLAQILAKPIKVFYREKVDGELMVMKFEP